MQASNELPIQRQGKLRRGLELTKSAWRVLKLDKELVALPAISILMSLVALAIFITVGLLYALHGQPVEGSHIDSRNISNWVKIPFLAVLYFVMTLIANIFNGAVIYGAAERFRGGDPTVRSSLRGALRRIRQLILFSMLASTIGLILQAVEERVPFAGKVTVWLANASWSIASVFAIPVIVLGDKEVGPVEATKESVQIIRKAWGESATAEAGLGILGAIGLFVLIMLAVLIGTVAFPLIGAGVAVGLGIAGALIIFGLVLVFATLSSIVKAALYHYATTGTAPEAFNQDLLRASMTPKKARKVFA